MGRSPDQRHRLGLRVDRDRRRRRHPARLAVSAGRERPDYFAGCRARRRAGCDPGVMVRQESRVGQDQKAAGLERNSSRPQRPHCRDQVAADPATRTCRADRWAGRDRRRTVASIARLLNIGSREFQYRRSSPGRATTVLLWLAACSQWRAKIRFECQTADTSPHSRGRMRPRFACRRPSKEGAGNAGCALHPRSRVQKAERKTHTSIQVQRRHSDIPCAMALRLITRSPRRIGLCCLRRLTEYGTSARSGVPHLRKT